MDPRRAQTERNAHFTRGPRFFRGPEAVMFEFVIDAGNVIGPRPATKADQAKHPAAWREFEIDIPPIEAESFEIPDPRAAALTEMAQLDADLIAPEQVDGQPVRRRKPRDQAA